MTRIERIAIVAVAMGVSGIGIVACAVEDVRRASITVSGRAIDEQGRPVAGATIYVIETNEIVHGHAPITTTTADAEGRYAVDVRLPLGPSERGGPEEGRFQVAGTAPGFGFTWYPSACFRDAEAPPNEAIVKELPAGIPKVFRRGEPIVIDLMFRPPASVRGKVVDDQGRPLAGAKVQVGVVDDPRGITWSCFLADPPGLPYWDARHFHGIRALPRSLLSTRTGANGTYRIDGLARNAEFQALIDPGPEYDIFEGRIATTAAVPSSARRLGSDGVLDRRFASPRNVTLRVRLADTKPFARGAVVRARPIADRAPILRAGGVGVTDADGSTTLQLRPDLYDVTIEPPDGMPYRPAHVKIPVGDAGGTFSPIELEPAAVVVMEAVDAKTGEGVAGVRFEYEADRDEPRRELRSQLAIVDHPATDKEGRLRAIIEPGRKRFFIAAAPEGWRHEGDPGRPTILVAGKERTIRWPFAKIEPALGKAVPMLTVFPDEVAAAWRDQDRRALPGRFHVRHLSFAAPGDSAPSRGEIEDFLDANDLARLPDPAAAIGRRFPTLRPGMPSQIEILDDGRRCRNTHRYTSKQPETVEVVVANGQQVITYNNATRQADIWWTGRGRRKVLGWRDLCARPAVLSRLGRGSPTMNSVRRERSADRLIVDDLAPLSVSRWVLDRTTGFVHAHSKKPTELGLRGVQLDIIRQYGPKQYDNGVVLPTVHVVAHLLKEKATSIDLDVIESAEFDVHLGPSDFAVSVPAGTAIEDHTGSSLQVRPKRICRYPVADVIGFTEAARAGPGRR